MIDELENGPWPSFISGIKKLRDTHPDNRINEMTNDLLGQLTSTNVGATTLDLSRTWEEGIWEHTFAVAVDATDGRVVGWTTLSQVA